MHNGGKIIIGIIIFAAIFSAFFWINFTDSGVSQAPNLQYIVDTSRVDCIMEKDYMKAYHMDLLDEWRDRVVRYDERYVTNEDGSYYLINGQKVEMSLSLTCLKCHENKAEFCDQCHNYLDVSPYCWDCHVEPLGSKSSMAMKEVE